MVRHHPQWQKARELAQKGKLGTLRAIQTLFSYHLLDPKNVRNIADIGGGALYDIGCYPIVTARYVFGADPIRAVALIDRDPNFHTDRTTSGLVDFGEGRHLTFTTTTQGAPFQRVNILGSKARLEVEIPFNTPPDRPARIYVDDGRQLGGLAAQAIEFPAADHYALQAERFVDAVRNRQRPRGD